MSMTYECRKCGREFDSRKGLGTHFGLSHEGHWLPEGKIARLYHEQELSQEDIADSLGVDQRTVQRAMNEYGIESDKSKNDPTKPPAHTFQKKGETFRAHYEVVQTTVDYEPKRAYIHRLIAVALGELDPAEFGDDRKVVHHKSGHGLDNRHENIEVLGRGEHQSLHLRERYSD